MTDIYAVGTRVGAWLKADHATVHLLGYGVYDGTFETIVTMEPNPRITLDNGKIVWGYECWWGPEERMKKSISNRTVINVDIDTARATALPD